MGLFGFKKRKEAAKSGKGPSCSECMRPIDGFVWEMEGKPYCRECYNRKMAIAGQTSAGAPEEYDFEMVVEDVFLIKNQGIVLTGKIRRGVIHRGDTVTVNQASYTVTRIDVIPNQVEYASEGMDAGLLLSTTDTSLFRRGDRVTAKRIAESAPQNTFVCEICKQEKRIKYRHTGYVCTACAEAGRRRPAAGTGGNDAKTTLTPELIAQLAGKEHAVRFGERTKVVWLADEDIHIDSEAFARWRKQNPFVPQYEFLGTIPLKEKTPVLSLYEDGVKTREYCLQTEGDEDFTGKYFLLSVRLSIHGNPAVPVAQIDGFVSDTPDDRKMTADDIGYRMEGHFLACGGVIGQRRYEMNRGQDLPMKALKYQGYTTPANVRLIGVCPECGKSFAFRGYAFYLGQTDVAYSDDGLDCCQIQTPDIDKDTWKYETEGKTFRYYNSFCCPHCKTPYIDYQKHPENKVFGVSGCVHLGRTPYRAK